MKVCTNCGAELGVGRFCTNCGARISPASATPDAPEATVVRPPRPDVPPPPPRFAPPPPPRPLFAPTPPPPPPPPLASRAPTPHRGRRTGFSPWWIVVLVLALAGSAALGTWLATVASDDDGGDGRTTEPTLATSPEPTSPGQPTPGAGQTDLAETATVTGPHPIPPGLDLNNHRVAYPATNMLDDDPESAYRLPGDASGAVIHFQLAEDSTVTQVGLVNGYTKVDTSGGSTVDWYPRNRRILRVEWSFDDGTAIEQALDPETREIQLIEVDDVETRTVQLTILEVSAPGAGPRARDVTAISDVLLVGS